MTTAESIRNEITRRLKHVVDLGNGVLRGDRQYDETTFATAYVDLSDDIVDRAQRLSEFQENLLGDRFFAGEGNQRWNSYLYFWAGPDSTGNAGFEAAKARIESDRHFARKFVLSDGDILNRIGDITESHPVDLIGDDAFTKWSQQLQQVSLDVVLDQPPRTQLLRLIESGDAFNTKASATAKPIPAAPDPLGSGMLRSLKVESFRSAVDGKPFLFGDVNLIVGQNGSGKTSLLELIEALYCGRVRRDQKAVFGNIEATVQLPDGKTQDVVGTSVVGVIKARNLAWYGRPDRQADSISDGFSRFNFLDTDAAFRLSSETKIENIKEDLNRLVVGPETSTLWGYLTKLHADVDSSLGSTTRELTAAAKEAELVGAEVTRLRETPSQALTLVKTYRADLRALGVKWGVGDDSAPIAPSDRTNLERLSRGLRQVLTHTFSDPITIEALRHRLSFLDASIAKLTQLSSTHEQLGRDFTLNEGKIATQQRILSELTQWKRYCDSSVPALMDAIRNSEEQAALLRSSLGGLTSTSVPDLPPEYGGRTLSSAREAAEAALAAAQSQEHASTESLRQLKEIGDSLQSLKADLYSIARAMVERTGDPTHCPVCGTHHAGNDLLQKIDALTVSSEHPSAEGLRIAIRESGERISRERRVIENISTLSRYAAASGASRTATLAELKAEVVDRHDRLQTILAEREQQRSTETFLRQTGLDLSRYDEARTAATALLDPANNAFNPAVVASALGEAERNLQGEQSASKSLMERRIDTVAQATALMREVEKSTSAELTPPGAVASAISLRERINTALLFAQEAAQQIDLPEAVSLATIEQAVAQAIASFDRAQHAETSERGAKTDLAKKDAELQGLVGRVNRLTQIRQRFETASVALGRITNGYSLDAATRDALGSIREQVSYIFARIHSPCEYELGDLQGDSILYTCAGKQPRGANQVSTGQRAALALSIFLALNHSARRAPPIMLIDDPVAHVDDLNALSFFDYLRDLAVSERKQIFFATADTRVAALFQKKFEFLGRDRFRQISLVR